MNSVSDGDKTDRWGKMGGWVLLFCNCGKQQRYL